MGRLITLLLCSLFIQKAFAIRCSDKKTADHFSVSFWEPVTYLSPVVEGQAAVIYQATYLPANDSLEFARLRRKAKWAKWLGIGSLLGLIVPFVNLLSLPAAITSLVLGGQVKRQTSDEHLRTDVSKGKLASTVVLIFLVAIAAISLLVDRLGRGPR